MKENRLKKWYSVNDKFRKKRFKIFDNLVNNIFKHKKKIHILDIGGTKTYWKKTNYWNNKRYTITTINLEKEINREKIATCS